MTATPFQVFLAGGLAGGIANTMTSPLEVIKTRLQSTVGQEVLYRFKVPLPLATATGPLHVQTQTTTTLGPRWVSYFRHVFKVEGPQAFFKGLLPTLVGSVPTRAIYFSSYTQFKEWYGQFRPRDSSIVHLQAAISAGMLTSTVTSPIWVIKTQMQLDNRPGKLMTVRNSIHSLYKTDGLRAFYRGLTASYAGTIETAIHFVIYERLKMLFSEHNERMVHPVECMMIAATSKMTASCLCYPHEVCRTRLRQNIKPSMRRYHSFFQTLSLIWCEEGSRGLYGGMVTHLLRVIPNTAIMFLSFETVMRIMERRRLQSP